MITLSNGEAKQIEILYVEPFDGYRIQFDWYPTNDSTDPVEMRMFLRAARARPSVRPGCTSISRRLRINATTLMTGL
ncbi:Glucans biosynthesis protein D precursor [Raoultella planticola]|uniref:Glucans biosynthesis protein D n=1 Tax=Raoultella planticola TaxID=575 RepID=A0A485CQD7_RAOPL|nr:Glucans biosynthesis protein D precursor [Raoultella planticola]